MTCRESENPIKTFQLFVNVSTYLYGLTVSYFEQTYFRFRFNHFFHHLIVHSNRDHSSFLRSSGYSFSFYFFSLFFVFMFFSLSVWNCSFLHSVNNDLQGSLFLLQSTYQLDPETKTFFNQRIFLWKVQIMLYLTTTIIICIFNLK